MSKNSNNAIRIHGARVNNLKNISVDLPQGKLIVITGLSGSGKSSLAFDTLYAEGQRRYVESLSSYARQFLGRMAKPDVDLIENIAPAVAIEQKVNSSNPRSTVGTSTEIYEYLKLMFARIGRTYSPVSGVEVKRHSVSDVVDYIYSLPSGTPVILFAPLLHAAEHPVIPQLQMLRQEGFMRVGVKGTVVLIDDYLASPSADNNDITLLVDRIRVAPGDDDQHARVAESRRVNQRFLLPLPGGSRLVLIFIFIMVLVFILILFCRIGFVWFILFLGLSGIRGHFFFAVSGRCVFRRLLFFRALALCRRFRFLGGFGCRFLSLFLRGGFRFLRGGFLLAVLLRFGAALP